MNATKTTEDINATLKAIKPEIDALARKAHRIFVLKARKVKLAADKLPVIVPDGNGTRQAPEWHIAWSSLLSRLLNDVQFACMMLNLKHVSSESEKLFKQRRKEQRRKGPPLPVLE